MKKMTIALISISLWGVFCAHQEEEEQAFVDQNEQGQSNSDDIAYEEEMQMEDSQQKKPKHRSGAKGAGTVIRKGHAITTSPEKLSRGGGHDDNSSDLFMNDNSYIMEINPVHHDQPIDPYNDEVSVSLNRYKQDLQKDFYNDIQLVSPESLKLQLFKLAESVKNFLACASVIEMADFDSVVKIMNPVLEIVRQGKTGTFFKKSAAQAGFKVMKALEHIESLEKKLQRKLFSAILNNLSSVSVEHDVSVRSIAASLKVILSDRYKYVLEHESLQDDIAEVLPMLDTLNRRLVDTHSSIHDVFVKTVARELSAIVESITSDSGEVINFPANTIYEPGVYSKTVLLEKMPVEIGIFGKQSIRIKDSSVVKVIYTIRKDLDALLPFANSLNETQLDAIMGNIKELEGYIFKVKPDKTEIARIQSIQADLEQLVVHASTAHQLQAIQSVIDDMLDDDEIQPVSGTKDVPVLLSPQQNPEVYQNVNDVVATVTIVMNNDQSLVKKNKMRILRSMQKEFAAANANLDNFKKKVEQVSLSLRNLLEGAKKLGEKIHVKIKNMKRDMRLLISYKSEGSRKRSTQVVAVEISPLQMSIDSSLAGSVHSLVENISDKGSKDSDYEADDEDEDEFAYEHLVEGALDAFTREALTTMPGHARLPSEYATLELFKKHVEGLLTWGEQVGLTSGSVPRYQARIDNEGRVAVEDFKTGESFVWNGQDWVIMWRLNKNNHNSWQEVDPAPIVSYDGYNDDASGDESGGQNNRSPRAHHATVNQAYNGLGQSGPASQVGTLTPQQRLLESIQKGKQLKRAPQGLSSRKTSGSSLGEAMQKAMEQRNLIGSTDTDDDGGDDWGDEPVGG